MAAGLQAIVILAFLLASGFLLVILSCALFQNWWPLFVVLMYGLAPIPNAIASSCFGNGSDDLFSEPHHGCLDAARFTTAIFVISGVALPIVLAHVEVISIAAMIMSVLGGLTVYVTLVVYAKHFGIQPEERGMYY